MQGHDLIYVPTDANDVNQIRFQKLGVAVGDTLSIADQGTALNALIANTPCLNEAKGKILTRNSCRLPFWNNVDVTIAQNIPIASMAQRVTLQLDIFDFGNLLNKNWGQQQVSPLSSNNNRIRSHDGFRDYTSLSPLDIEAIEVYHGIGTEATSLRRSEG